MDVKLTDADLKGVLSEAILRSLDEKTRGALIQAAIQDLLTVRDVYGKQSCKLQDAFERALFDVALEECKKVVLAENGLRTQIAGFVAKAVEKMLADDEKIVRKLADAVEKALIPERY